MASNNSSVEKASDEDRTGALENQLLHLKSDLSNVKLEIEVERTKQEIELQRQFLQDLKVKKIPHEAGVGDTIAFHATISRHQNNVAINTVLVFDKAITNVGEAYNLRNGIFTAPREGTYQFQWNYLTNKGGTAYLVLMVNDQLKQYSCIGGCGSTCDSGTGFFLTTLKTGDRVWIQHSAYTTTFLHHSYTTFSGFRI